MDPTTILQSGGLIALGLIIFAESGMMIGFFFPGDSLLLSAGILASQGQLPIGLTIVVVAVAAMLGDNTGYQLGQAMGPRLFRKPDGILFRQEYVTKAEKFYEKHGAKTMLVAHFIPGVRSFAPLVAGVGKMPRLKFFICDATGIVVWSALVTLLGFWLGSRFEHLDRYILPLVLSAMIISSIPTLWHILGNRQSRQRLTAKFRSRKSPPC